MNASPDDAEEHMNDEGRDLVIATTLMDIWSDIHMSTTYRRAFATSRGMSLRYVTKGIMAL